MLCLFVIVTIINISLASPLFSSPAV